MKIAEETGDPDMKEQAKVNFGMANASMKWHNHVTNILQNIQQENKHQDHMEEDDDDDEGGMIADSNKLPDIKK